MDTRGFRTSERGRRSGLGGWVPDGQLGRRTAARRSRISVSLIHSPNARISQLSDLRQLDSYRLDPCLDSDLNNPKAAVGGNHADVSAAFQAGEADLTRVRQLAI
jgi:hypothetical protein